MATKSGARICRYGSMACSPSPCSIGAAVSFSLPATGLARSRFTTAHDLGCSPSPASLTALPATPRCHAQSIVTSLQKFFAYGYLPAPRAMLEGTAKLPGGHWLRYDIDSAALVVKPYWQFVLEPDLALSDNDEPRLVEECAALLQQAARRRLMSDVPLGVFLSGGLDSSSVLASLADAVPASNLSTFTIGFDEPSFRRDRARPYRRRAHWHRSSRALPRSREGARSHSRMSSASSTSRWAMPRYCRPIFSARSPARR